MSGPKSRGVPRLLAACSAALLGVTSLAGCRERSQEPAAAKPVPPAQAREHKKPELTHRGGAQPLEQFVQEHVERAEASGTRVLVYVGAKWCEPCQRFHRALEAGELDDALHDTQFLEFDVDKDLPELKAAGYGSKYIPLFSVPDVTGHASGRAIEGSVKGDQAVRKDLVPRLVALLDGKPGE